MDRDGTWALSPAFDVVYAFNPKGRQTSRHQMSINGKRDRRLLGRRLAQRRERCSLKRGQAEEILAEVTAAVKAWPQLATAAGLDESRIERIKAAQRSELPLN